MRRASRHCRRSCPVYVRRTVHIQNRLFLVAEVRQFGHAGLHAIGHFILSHARGNLRVMDRLKALRVQAVEGVEPIVTKPQCHNNHNVTKTDGGMLKHQSQQSRSHMMYLAHQRERIT